MKILLVIVGWCAFSVVLGIIVGKVMSFSDKMEGGS